MTEALRDRQKDRFCDALDAVDPGAPTLCAEWDAHDLAVHLWVLKHEPTVWPGEFTPIPRLKAYSRERTRRIREQWSYSELVERLRADKGSIACMPGDSLEGHRHALGEYFVHTIDITRANGLPEAPPDTEFEDALWRRVKVAAPALHLIATPSLILRRPDGDQARVSLPLPGRRTVVTGKPSELMCWVYGRTTVADVTVERS